MTCRTDRRALLETANCVIERPRLDQRLDTRANVPRESLRVEIITLVGL